MERRYEAYKTHVVQAVLPRPFRPARPPDRAGRRADGAELRPGGAARSRERARRSAARLPRRPRLALRLDLPPAHRPHPVRRDQGRPPAPHEPRPARGDPEGADRQGHRPRRGGRRRDRRHRARGHPRHPRGRDPPATARCWTRSSARRRRARRSAARRSTASPRPPSFRASLPADPMAIFAGDAHRAARGGQRLALRPLPPAGRPRAASPRRRSGSTARCNS